MTPIWAIDLGMPGKIMLVAVALVAGTLIVNVLILVIAGAVYKQKFPASVRWGVSGLAGLLTAWITYLALSGGGGTGIGGPGGPSTGGKGGSDKAAATAKEKGKDHKEEPIKEKNADKKSKDVPDTEKVMVVEILGDVPLKKLAKDKGKEFDPARRYRIQDDPGSPRTFEELQQIVLEAHKRSERPLRKMIVVFYKAEGPDRDNPLVTDLTNWLKGVGSKKTMDAIDPEIREVPGAFEGKRIQP